MVTDVPGSRAIARPGANALLVPPDDAQALADAIGVLAHDDNLSRKLGAAGRHLVESKFADVVIGREIRALYDRLIGRRT